MFFIEEKQLQTSLLFNQNQKPGSFLSTVLESNGHGLFFLSFCCWFKTAKLLANILIRTMRLCRNGIFSQITCFDRLQTYMTANLLWWMYVTLSWKKRRTKQIDFKAEPLMCLDLASCMKSLYHTSEQYCIKQREFPILAFNSKVICKWPFFKSGDRCGFFLTTRHIFFWVWVEKKEWSPLQILYNKLIICLSPSIKAFMHIRFCFLQPKVIEISAKESDYWYN